MKVAVIGAGWAGCAAAVEATRLGHQITLFEATKSAGGRARRVMHGQQSLDNGQHILIGAYSECLGLMAAIKTDLKAASKTTSKTTSKINLKADSKPDQTPDLALESELLRLPLTLTFPDGSGLRLPLLPAPFDALLGIARAGGWSWRDKWALLKLCLSWQRKNFTCPPSTSVAALCQDLPETVRRTLIEPLCVSALNTPMERASGEVFLRVLRDTLLSRKGGSNLLLPLCDLSALMPEPALEWLGQHGATVRMASRVGRINMQEKAWLIDSQGAPPEMFEALVLACPALEAARLIEACGQPNLTWQAQAKGMSYEPITTVYAIASGTRLSQPMLALASKPEFPAQFVIDRGQLGGPAGLLAFVVSASRGDSQTLTQQVIIQGIEQLGLKSLEPVQTIIEKRATFACTPGLARPSMAVAPGLLACGDYITGPYPATLEGAVRSGLAAARALPAAL